jgi:RNA polymerase sigma factor (sigma-70 family)
MVEPGISQPQPLEALARPGLSWTLAEREAICDWLLEARRYRQLLLFALRRLGESAGEADAEDAVGEFLLKKLPGIIARYDPARSTTKSPFLSFVLSCLRQSCSNFRLRLARPQRIFLVRGDEDPGVLEKIIDDLDLERLIENRDLVAEVRQALKIMPSHFSRIIMLAAEEKTTAEIAREIGLTETNTRTRLSRSRQMLRGLINRRSNQR